MTVRNAAVLVALALLALAPAVGAAVRATSYTDAAGDSLTAPDETAIAVSNDAAGAITFKVTVANRPGPLNGDDAVAVAIDADRNAGTGDSDGMEYLVALGPGGAAALKWDGSHYAAYAHGPVSGSYSSGTAQITIGKADLGGVAAFDFFTMTLAADAPQQDRDYAPENGVFTYTLTVPPKATPAKIGSADTYFTAAAPKAGKVFGVTGVTVYLTDKTFGKTSPASCSAKLAGRALNPVGRCRWKVPATAKGKKLVVTVSVSYKGHAGTIEPYVFKIR